jgi:hypothetical protein
MTGDRDIEKVWSFEPPVASLRCGQLSGQVDVSRPDLGLSCAAFGMHPVQGALLQVQRRDESERATAVSNVSAFRQLWPLAVAEAYVRGDDLIGSYQATRDWPYSPQIYWRANSLSSVSEVVGSLSMLISVQTQLLDTWPQISVHSQLVSDETLEVMPDDDGRPCAKAIKDGDVLRPRTDPCCVVRRPSKLPLSYVEIMPASDFRTLKFHVESDGSDSIQWEIFGEFLEKGVIWRARVHSALVLRENDLEIAVACINATQRAALPLTV